jgi:Protein of unknown function (DUF4232)
MRLAVVVLICAASIAAFVAATSVEGTSSASSCAPLSLFSGPLWSEETGQHTATFVLTNRSQHACVFDGYPLVRLLDPHRRLLRFRYSHAGDQMITSRPPHRLVVQRRGRVFFALNKYRCDIRATAGARFIRVQLPGQSAWLQLRLSLYPSLDYCAEKPSLIVTVSPLVESLAKATGTP